MKKKESSESIKKLYKLFDDSMYLVDESLSIEDFAITVALIVMEQYGTHNYKEFIEIQKTLLDPSGNFQIKEQLLSQFMKN
tara:strand:+ start:566 stop:808 length:243 start_codon:yes stop_codon:yes gene_type:complete